MQEEKRYCEFPSKCAAHGTNIQTVSEERIESLEYMKLEVTGVNFFLFFNIYFLFYYAMNFITCIQSSNPIL